VHKKSVKSAGKQLYICCMKQNKQIQEIISHLDNGGTYQNDLSGYQYVKRVDGVMLKYANDKYTFYTDINKMAKAILKSLNTGK
jgi:hypothetical protein